MTTTHNIALGIIDAQRGFMPAAEGERLQLPGFGELPIENGEKIVPRLNQLLGEFAVNGCYNTFTTQDWHPPVTAHFSTEPNFNTTWPVHCVQETPGALLHPDLRVKKVTAQFLKGNEQLADGADDTSYSGYNGANAEGITLPEWLSLCEVWEVFLGGLALDYCVKATALDLRQKMKMKVNVVSDATEAVADETGRQALDELRAAGVHIVTTEEAFRYIEELGR